MEQEKNAIDRFIEFTNSGRHRSEELPSDIAEGMNEWLYERAQQYEYPLRPPWEEMPHIPFGSIGWRMGPGEDYWTVFLEWARSLTGDEYVSYVHLNKEPDSWEGFYELVRPIFRSGE
ncbi:hypothetical protein [Yoonia sp. I 8.24]|uniref:hypothetical protein n=1 Tax=Yoonia sp. I 8.24 TaxID=1537229 RepID=UPI001EDD7E98|nr:hypothetical protein [Yoonia sp. I 8.24]MCG3266621.1 hypothetical protein [Yoonia sp. I 8.24]